MAQRRRDDGADAVQMQPSPSPSLLSLPDIAHSCITSFLRDGNKGNDSRLRVAEASRVLLEAYGGSLTKMCLSFREGSSAGRLAALLRRNEELAEVSEQQEATAAFCQAIVQDCCRGIGSITVCHDRDCALTKERSSLLAGALEVHGALPALRSFTLQCEGTRGVLCELASAIIGGASPQLQELSLTTEFDDSELEFLADLLEASVRTPGCKRLERFEGYEGWLDKASLPARIRILRALLPSVKDLEQFEWRHGFKACFREVQAPCLTTFAVWLGYDEELQIFSCNVLEAAPALVNLVMRIVRPRHCATQQSGNRSLRPCGMARYTTFSNWKWSTALPEMGLSNAS